MEKVAESANEITERRQKEKNDKSGPNTVTVKRKLTEKVECKREL